MQMTGLKVQVVLSAASGAPSKATWLKVTRVASQNLERS